jgi:intracellular sulfur oxidation DsrE/DsrF family protein
MFTVLTLAAALLFASAAPGPQAAWAAGVVHKLAIHVDENDPKVMNLALNNAENVTNYYESQGDTVIIEIVTYGPGLHMLRSDTSPVKARIEAMSLGMDNLSFAACGNTMTKMAKKEGKDIPIMPEAKQVVAGVVRLIELQEDGYSYLRP